MLSSPLPVPHLNEKREIIKIPEAEIIKIIQCEVAGVGAGAKDGNRKATKQKR